VSTQEQTYALGHSREELHRLDRQSETLAPATRVILGQAGIAPGMRVLDLGTGTGEVARLLAELVGPGGHVVGVDRATPALDVAAQAVRWLDEAFRRVGANPVIGTRLALLLEAAGVERPSTFGVTTYHPADQSEGPFLMSAVVKSMLPLITTSGIATLDEIGPETLEARLAEQLSARDAVFVAPTLVGAWGTVGC
jgi:SAM-dependent methyltransferase